MYLWLVSAIVASYLSDRKGYGEKAGPGHRPAACRWSAIVIWLVWPAKPESKWKHLGPFGRGKKTRPAAEPRSAAAARSAGGLRLRTWRSIAGVR